MSRTRRALTGTFMVLATIAAVTVMAPGSATAAQPATISVRGSVSSVPVGGSMIVSGYVRGAGRGLAGVPVEIWVRPVGATAWKHTANAWTTSAGGYSLRQTYTQASVTKARFPGGRGYAAAEATTVTAVHQSFAAVSIKVCANQPDNAWIEWKGRTSPAAAGSYAIAEWRFAGFPDFPLPWERGAITKVRADGTFSAKATTDVLEVYEARWVLNGRTNVAGATSPTYLAVGPAVDPGVVQCEQFSRE